MAQHRIGTQEEWQAERDALRPVINEVGRDLTAPVTIGGHRLPAGTRVMCSLGAVHRDDGNHPEPAAFRPQRFLGWVQPPPYVWIPFGGGVRRWVGASFAMLEMSIMLRTILERQSFRSLLTR